MVPAQPAIGQTDKINYMSEKVFSELLKRDMSAPVSIITREHHVVKHLDNNCPHRVTKSVEEYEGVKCIAYTIKGKGSHIYIVCS